MFDRITLAQDLLDCRGGVLGRKGLVVSPDAIDEAAAAARPGPALPLSETAVAEDLHLPMGEPAYRHLFRGPGVQASVARTILAIALPEALYAELAAVKAADPGRYRHGLATAALAAGVLHAAVGEARSLPDLAAAALLHDLGMRHLPPRLARSTDWLRPEEARDVSAHPLLGAWHLACALGRHPAVEAALSHHWRRATRGSPARRRARWRWWRWRAPSRRSPSRAPSAPSRSTPAARWTCSSPRRRPARSTPPA
jgi:hypothetical protein